LCYVMLCCVVLTETIGKLNIYSNIYVCCKDRKKINSLEIKIKNKQEVYLIIFH